MSLSVKCCQFLAVTGFSIAMLVVSVMPSSVVRQKRSDDGDPLEAVVEQLSAQVNHLNAQLSSVNTEVAALKTKTDKNVAFHAWSGVDPVQVQAYGIIILSHVITNVGNAYDSLTGVFTTPVMGLYYFQATIMSHDTHSYVYGLISVDNNNSVATAVSSGNGGWNQSTMNCILHLNAGQKVFLKNPDNAVKEYHGSPTNPYTTFSGFLVNAD